MVTQISGQRKSLEEVGEFGLISSIRNILRASKEVSTGLVNEIGDDTAIWQPRRGWRTVITTDMMIEGTHWRHAWSKGESVGHRALAINLSDLAATGAHPRIATISLGLKGTETDRWVYDLYKAALSLGKRFHFKIAGGDIVKSPDRTTVGVTFIGEIPPHRVPLERGRAQEGDVIAVTGPLGLAAAGYRALLNDNIQVEGSPRMLKAFRRPEPRVLQGILLGIAGVRCAMDLSDGLLGDLPKICDASGFSATLIEDALPVPHSVRWSNEDWRDLVLRFGEDFELLFTCPPEVFETVSKLFVRWGCQAPIEIGYMRPSASVTNEIELMKTNRMREVLEPGAWDHFASASR